jgi:hypothetical protein
LTRGWIKSNGKSHHSRAAFTLEREFTGKNGKKEVNPGKWENSRDKYFVTGYFLTKNKKISRKVLNGNDNDFSIFC